VFCFRKSRINENGGKNTGKTEYENAQETSTLCHAISTAFQKFEKHNQGQGILNANTQRDIQGAN